MTDIQSWLDSTAIGELRDSLNFRGVPGSGAGASVPSQSGTRGSAIVDYRCLAGLEFYKQSHFLGTGNARNNARDNTGDPLWSTNSNNDLSLILTTLSHRRGPQGAHTEAIPVFGVMMIGRQAATTLPRDVFGGIPSSITLISGTYAWRLPIAATTARQGPSGRIVTAPSNTLRDWQPRYDYGSTVTPATDRYGYGWLSGGDTDDDPVVFGSRFERNPPTATVYQMACNYLMSELGTVPTDGGATLINLLLANYATFRVYDFTIQTPGGTAVPSAMPRSLSNTTGGYITDAIIEPIQAQRIEGRAEFQTAYDATVNRGFAISSIPSTAFRTTPGALAFTVAVTPASADIDGLGWDYMNGNLGLLATKAGEYTLTITASLNVNPSYVAVQTITITATE